MSCQQYRCRKCSYTLFDDTNLILHGESEQDSCFATLFHIAIEDTEKIPEWINDVIQKGHYEKGKLNCPKCGGRIGAFDFVTPIKCGCSQHVTPPVRVAKNRVDVVNPTVNARNTVIYSQKRIRNNLSENLPGANNVVDLTHATDALRGLDHDSVQLFGPDDNGEKAELKNRSQSYQNLDSSETKTCENVSSNCNMNDAMARGCMPISGQGDREVKEQSTESDTTEELPNQYSNRYDPLGEIEESNLQEKPKEEEEEIQSPPDVEMELYTCSVCLDIFYKPNICYPCKHNFCDPCLRRLRDSTPIDTKCPLCREVIVTCLPNNDLCQTVQNMFPQQHQTRKSTERRAKGKLPGHNNGLLGRTRRRRQTNNNNVLLHGAGVCFAVLCVMMAAVVFITTVAFVLWFLWELIADVLLEVIIKFNNFYDTVWTFLMIVVAEGRISPEVGKVLMGSIAQMMHAFSKIKNSTDQAEEILFEEFEEMQNRTTEYLNFNKFTTADVANYTLLMFVVSYFIYRAARHIQARQRDGIIHVDNEE